MDLVAAVARVVIGAVFAVAGATKLRDPGWGADARSMGVPGPVARVLPVVELAAGAITVAGLAQPWAAALLLVLLVGFTAGLVRLLVAGRRPRCACFGAWSRRPLSWRAVARNVGLGLVAVVAVAG